MDPADVGVVQSLADVATIAILVERSIRNTEMVTEQLRGALNSRIVIEQAKGMLAQIHGVTPDQGFEQLRSYCRSHSARVSEVAQALVNDPASVQDLTTAE